jgi:hypothetical protein|tara:strand:+ start:342 stop:632 length:291 start_codon:yes stop_codon:yes gene_type:complete
MFERYDRSDLLNYLSRRGYNTESKNVRYNTESDLRIAAAIDYVSEKILIEGITGSDLIKSAMEKLKRNAFTTNHLTPQERRKYIDAHEFNDENEFF